MSCYVGWRNNGGLSRDEFVWYEQWMWFGRELVGFACWIYGFGDRPAGGFLLQISAGQLVLRFGFLSRSLLWTLGWVLSETEGENSLRFRSWLLLDVD